MKRILWIVGITLPQASELIGEPKIPFGGWVSQMIDSLSKNEDYKIAVAMKSDCTELLKKEQKGVTYYYIPNKKKNKFDVNKIDCKTILEDFKPDLLHAEGTEQAYTNTFLKEWKGNNLVSLQGIINAYEPYEFGGLDPYKFIFSFNLRNVLFGLSMIVNKRLIFNKRLKIEEDTIKRAKNIIGRTIWDRSNSYFFNIDASYFVCRRILRPSFYQIKRVDDEIIPFSLFIGNSAQMRKGAHFVFKAVHLLKKEFPEIKLYIAGQKFENNIRDWKSYVGYRGYLKRLVKKLNLENNITFLGIMQEKQMAKSLAKMQVFIMSSIIENSPNTLGEAMIMGVPCVASYNGGVSQMAVDEKEALLYRDNDPKMLAYQIKRFFENPELCKQISKNAKSKAEITHNREKNLNDLLTCYSAILNK